LCRHCPACFFGPWAGRDRVQQDDEREKGADKDQANGASTAEPFQIPFLVDLAISLVQRVLRMGEQVGLLLLPLLLLLLLRSVVWCWGRK